MQPLVRIERRQVIERHLVPRPLGILEIDCGDPHESKIALPVARAADCSFHRVPGSQTELTDLLGRDIDIIRSGQIVGLRGTHEAETVWQHLQDAGADDLHIALGQLFEDGEHQFLLGEQGCALHLKIFRLSQKLGRRFLLEIVEEHAFVRFGHVIGHGSSDGSKGGAVRTPPAHGCAEENGRTFLTARVECWPDGQQRG